MEAARVHLFERLGMIFIVRVHAAEHAKLVSVPADFREQLNNLRPALSALLEPPPRTEQLALPLPSLLSVSGGECGLRVKCLHVRWPATHAQKNDALCPRRKMRALNGELPCASARSTLRRKSSEGHVAKPGGYGAQPVAAGIGKKRGDHDNTDLS